MLFELNRLPTEEEIIEKVGISPERYREVMRASKPVYSLQSRHAVTQEELIDSVTDVEGVGGDARRQPALLRLALDDVVFTYLNVPLTLNSSFFTLMTLTFLALLLQLHYKWISVIGELQLTIIHV